MNIKKQIVSSSVINGRSYGYGNPCTSITIHETGNTGKGADAQAHANLQSNYNPRQASWHFQVDDKEIIQSFPETVRCWSAGDGKDPKGGNYTSIHIEMCVNSDGNYIKTVARTAELVRYLMDKHNIPVSKVVQHHHWSGKNCPSYLRSSKHGISWGVFKSMLEKEEPKTSELWKVQVGAFSKKSNAEALAKELEKKGYPTYITKN